MADHPFVAFFRKHWPTVYAAIPDDTILLVSQLALSYSNHYEHFPVILRYLRFPGKPVIVFGDTLPETLRLYRDEISSILHERLISVPEVRHLEAHYRQQIDIPMVEYGDHWQQKWGFLRDVLATTRDRRRERRSRNRCVICGRMCSGRWIFDEDRPFVFLREAVPEIIRRFFTVPAWKSRDRCQYVDRRRVQGELDCYKLAERDTRVCSEACEVSRFARYRGKLYWSARLRTKELGAERYESRCLKEARESLKRVRRLLNQSPHEALKLPERESIPALSSPSS